MSHHSFVKNVYGPPPEAVSFGCQNNGGGKLWSAIAHTEHGPIGGKANRDTCWYPFGGKEHLTKEFSYLVAPEGRVVPFVNKGNGPPHNVISLGRQNNDGTEYYAAVALCDHGLVPGKGRDNTCWYPFGDKEQITDKFLWLAWV